MNDKEDVIVTPVQNCQVCGENDFEQRAGFYYCNECGTKHDQVQAVRVESDEEHAGKMHAKKIKIKAANEDDVTSELTSWECYNYILRGLVEELLTMGAKEELKLMTLQLWAAYLRRLQVAFFNKKHADLPKLGVNFKKRDAKALYNHCQQKRKIRKERKSSNISLRSSELSSKREYNKSKRKLDASIYSQSSACSASKSSSNEINLSTSDNSISSGTSSGGSSRAIQLKFSSNARKYLKKRMPVKHLKQHEKDGEGLLECHSLNIKTTEIQHLDYQFTTMNMKQMFALLGIALNLIGDDIQISDIVRFISEGHLPHKDVMKFFPENIAKNGVKILDDIGFYTNRDTYSDKVLRYSATIFAKGIHIREFRTPNLLGLIQRYVTEMSLPQDVYVYAERLFNFLPPQMKTRRQQMFPLYEARCMAYIIFTLKLLFGLDGHKDKLISDASKTINKRLDRLAENNSSDPSNTEEKHSHLFVWDEWVEYIEMRKVIISQYNSAFAERFEETQNLDFFVEELAVNKNKKSDADITETVTAAVNNNLRVTNMQTLFENLHTKLTAESKSNTPDTIEFEASLMPAHNYFKRVLLHHRSNNSTYLKIPEYMHIDHSQRTLQPHMDTRPLANFFKTHGISMEVEIIPCTSDTNYVGMFGTAEDVIGKHKIRVFEADFDIDTAEWLKAVKAHPIIDDLIFKTELDSYTKKYMREVELKLLKKRTNSYIEMKRMTNDTVSGSIHSLDVFDENNMDPLKHIILNNPRDNLDEVNIFAGINFDERLHGKAVQTNDIEETATIVKEEFSEADTAEITEKITFVTSAMDHWMLLGSISSLDGHKQKCVQHKLPRTFVWLLEYCAQTVNIDWSVLYEQLLVIETMYCYGIENLDDFKDYIRFKHMNHVKDINALVIRNRKIW